MPDASTRNPYQHLREQIDRIDAELLRLLNERAEAALEIGRLKRANGEAIHVPERERSVIERAVRANRGPLDNGAVSALFEAIITHIRALEERGTQH
ncbi:MAG TPA: chorismate mutase [bacterium]|nr:chorismate mutase [bacterium]